MVPVPVPSLSDEQVTRILAAIKAVPFATANVPIKYTAGDVSWIQEDANNAAALRVVQRQNRELTQQLAALHSAIPAMCKQAVLDALAVSTIVTTTTIGGKP